MTAPPVRAFVFQCSGNTYMECIEKSVFGSNDPWPMQVKKGDCCLLHHYEYDTVFGLWRANSDGGKKLVAKAWGGKFPFQAIVTLVTSKIIEMPKGCVGSAERILEGQRATAVFDLIRTVTPIPETLP